MTLGVIVLLLLANSRNLSDVLLALGPLRLHCSEGCGFFGQWDCG